MKKVVVFSYGNPLSAKTWSNMSYYLIKTLESLNYEVVPIDLYPYNSILSKIYGLRRIILSRLRGKDLLISYDRSALFHYLIRRKLRKAVLNNDFDFSISLTYSFNPKEFTDKPCIMICDWTIDYLVEHICKRRIDSSELKGVEIQNMYLQRSDLNITIFKEVEEYYRGSGKKIKYLGNVINLPSIEVSHTDQINKYNSKNIVFIGKEKYISALECLIEALNLLDFEVNLSVIGISSSKNRYINTTYYGYLDKTNEKQLQEYISILKNAKVVINTNSVFAGFTALAEGMCLGTPVITSKTETFLEVFGSDANYGFFSSNDPKYLSRTIQSFFSLSEKKYLDLSNNCIRKSKEFSWDNFICELISQVEDIIDEEK